MNNNIKEYAIYCKYGNGTPFILNTYKNFDLAKNKLLDIIELEEERGRPYFVDNYFFENKYNINLKGKYFCIMERQITEWKRLKTLNDKMDNLIYVKF